MKIHQLILLTTALFVVLFYDENTGVNLGILAVVYALLSLFSAPAKNRTKTFYVLLATSVFSGIAFAWFGDFVSFLAVFCSLFLLDLKSKSRNLKSILVVPVLITNFFTFLCRFFRFEDWIPRKNFSGSTQKIISLILIPAFFLIVFFAVYSYGSEHFAKIIKDFKFNLDFLQFTALLILGFFIAFNFWNLQINRFIYKANPSLDDDFSKSVEIQKPTYTFMDVNAERNSGVATFLVLNILLLIFIFTFNYEQFVEISKSPNQLSEETHERVNAVILSIVLAIVVIMFYFKGGFNFDPKAALLKIFAGIWIVLNAVLVFSAMAKNLEYVLNYGYTYKRLGVFAFLMLCLIGLIFTCLKIQKKKTNAYLFNRMFWYGYAMVLVCSYFNWGGFITSQNMKRKDFEVNFHRDEINFNEKQLLKYAKEYQDRELEISVLKEILPKQKESFLSENLYYQTIKTKP